MFTRLPLFLVLLALPFAAPASAGDWDGCTPVSDPRAVSVAPGVYVLTYSKGMNTYTETWQEDNGIAGLQTSSAAACGGASDFLVNRACAGRFCMMQGF